VAVADASVAETAVPTTSPLQPEADGGSNIGLIVLGAAVVLILLAGVGVYLLRQS
jgi:hypothetical protein